MYQHDKKTGQVQRAKDGTPLPKTAHSLNPVPCYIYEPVPPARLKLVPNDGLGISSLAATCMNLLGFEAPGDYDPSVVEPA